MRAMALTLAGHKLLCARSLFHHRKRILAGRNVAGLASVIFSFRSILIRYDIMIRLIDIES